MTCRFLDLVDVKFDSGHKKKKKACCRKVFILLSAGGTSEQLSF